MRPRSMTGFGRGEAAGSDHGWTVELRSVNHRFLDCKIMLPKQLAVLEERVRHRVAAGHERGRVELMCSLRQERQSAIRPVLDLPLAREYNACLQQLVEELDLPEEPRLEHMLQFRDIISLREESPDQEALWQSLCQAVDGAVEGCCRMREQEGQTLARDLRERLTSFEATLEQLALRLPEVRQQREQALRERLERSLAGLALDPARLAQEAAILVDKSDVTEELVRLRSHIGQFVGFLALDEPVGRRLDFLLQEFLREVNTLASKIADAAIAQLTVELKNEIEKIREQVQNLE